MILMIVYKSHATSERRSRGGGETEAEQREECRAERAEAQMRGAETRRKGAEQERRRGQNGQSSVRSDKEKH